MSLTSKLTLGAAVTFTVSIVTYVHVSQKRDREVSLYSGVLSVEVVYVAAILSRSRSSLVLDVVVVVVLKMSECRSKDLYI